MTTVSPHTHKGNLHYVYTYAYPESMGGAVFYVGKGYKSRINYHEYEAKGKRPIGNLHKVNIIKKIWAHGEQVVKAKIAYFATHEEALQYEIALIFFMDGLTNLTEGGEGCTGVHHPMSEGMKQRLSEANKGRKRSEEEIRRSVEARKGFRHSEETKRKLSEARHGTKRTYVESEETKRKRFETLRRNGYTHSEETRVRQSAAKKGKPVHSQSIETREKIRQASLKHRHSEEVKRKLSELRSQRAIARRDSVQEIRLKYWRTQQGMTQSQLATSAHLSRDAIGRIELGKTIPEEKTLQVLASVLGITMEQLVIRSSYEQE